MKKALGVLAILAVFAMAGAAYLFGARTPVRVPTPPDAQNLPPAGFPHEVFDRVLKKHVDDDGRVDYATLRKDRTDLTRYLHAVHLTSPHQAPERFPSKADKLAYSINAYNAAVMFAVSERPAMKSLAEQRIEFFGLLQFDLGGEWTTLYALENDIIRGEFDEPRIHFALNCASLGCPELPNEAFVPERLEEQLARETRAFCGDAKNLEAADETLEVSEIFDWYAEDFSDHGGPAGFCKRWGRPELDADAVIVFKPYDWRVNAQSSGDSAEGGAPSEAAPAADTSSTSTRS